MARDIGALQTNGLDIGAVETNDNPYLIKDISGDSLNNLFGAQDFALSYLLLFSDTFSLSDTISIFYNINVVPLTRSVVDNSIVPTGKYKTDGLKDGIQIYAGIESGLFISLDDLGNFLTDGAEIGFIVWFNDTPVLAYDSMWYNLADAIAVNAAVPRNPTDAINLSDSLGFFMPGLFGMADVLAISDEIQIAFRTIPLFADTLVMSDAVVVGAAELLSLAISDALSLTDSTGNFKSTSFNAYIRRFLNDVIK